MRLDLPKYAANIGNVYNQPETSSPIRRSPRSQPPLKHVKKASPNLPALTGLRALAAVLVVLSHFCGSGGTLGQLGVQIFFVLSAYLMCLLYLETPRGDTVFARLKFALNFMRNRVARVVPLSVALYILSAIFHLIPRTRHLAIYQIEQPLWEYLVLRAASGVQWTIAVEFCFYIFFAFVLVLPPKAARIFFALITLSSIAVFIVPTAMRFERLTGICWGIPTEKAYVYKYFALGALCFEIHRFCATRSVAVSFSRNPSTVIGMSFHFLCTSFLLVSLTIRAFRWHNFAGSNSWTSIQDAALICALLLGSLCLWPLGALFNTRLFQHIGKVSYSLYLTHMFMFFPFSHHSLTDGSPEKAFLFVFACTILATVSFYVIEKPSLRFLRSKATPSSIPEWAVERDGESIPFQIKLNFGTK